MMKRYRIHIYKETERDDEITLTYLDRMLISPEALTELQKRNEHTEQMLGAEVAQKIRYWSSPYKKAEHRHIRAIDTPRHVVSPLTFEAALEYCEDCKYKLTYDATDATEGLWVARNHDDTLSAEDRHSPLKACQRLYEADIKKKEDNT